MIWQVSKHQCTEDVFCKSVLDKSSFCLVYMLYISSRKLTKARANELPDVFNICPNSPPLFHMTNFFTSAVIIPHFR